MELHAHLIKFGFSRDPSLRNHLVTLYSKCRRFGYARKLVDESSELDVVSWSSLLSGYVQNGFVEEALLVFNEMCLLGVKCNERKRGVSGNAGNQTIKRVLPLEVHCDRLCLCYFAI